LTFYYISRGLKDFTKLQSMGRPAPRSKKKIFIEFELENKIANTS
jgi:hypothetical protein